MSLRSLFSRASSDEPEEAAVSSDFSSADDVPTASAAPSQVLREIFNPVRAGRRLMASWLICCCVLVGWFENFTTLTFPENVPIWQIPVFTLALFTVFSLLATRLSARLDSFLLSASSVVFSLLLAYHYNGRDLPGFYVSLLIVLAIILLPLWLEQKPEEVRLTLGRRGRNIGILICGLVFVGIVGTLTCLRYTNYLAPNYDFGIFCNMFYNMKTSLLPMVTCERDMLLSHFAVHVSPIYYVLLPFYAIFPSPLTLQIGQAAVLASSLIPLCLLAKKYQLSDGETLLLSIAAACYPALSAGTFYDIHENCFLPPLLLWLFVCYEYQRFGWMYVAAAGVLMVKEDAAAYVLIFALYLFFARRERWHGALLAGVSLLYFATALYLLGAFGEGGMTYRYGNLSAGDGGLMGVLVTFLRNPAYVLTQLLFTDNGNAGKWLYLLKLFAPLALLPVCARRFSRFLLLTPLLLNLLTTYVYQYDINFQYSFGITAFLFYLAVLNAADRPQTTRRAHLRFAALASSLLFILVCLPTLQSQLSWNKNHGDTFRQMDEILETIPEDASVTTSTFLLPHLANRAEIYEIYYHGDKTDTDYLVLDIRSWTQRESEELAQKWRDAGYETIARHEDMIEILKKPTA